MHAKIGLHDVVSNLGTCFLLRFLFSRIFRKLLMILTLFQNIKRSRVDAELIALLQRFRIIFNTFLVRSRKFYVYLNHYFIVIIALIAVHYTTDGKIQVIIMLDNVSDHMSRILLLYERLSLKIEIYRLNVDFSNTLLNDYDEFC